MRAVLRRLRDHGLSLVFAGLLLVALVGQAVAGLAERYRLAVDPSARIWLLSVGEQQRV